MEKYIGYDYYDGLFPAYWDIILIQEIFMYDENTDARLHNGEKQVCWGDINCINKWKYRKNLWDALHTIKTKQMIRLLAKKMRNTTRFHYNYNLLISHTYLLHEENWVPTYIIECYSTMVSSLLYIVQYPRSTWIIHLLR